MMYDAFYDFLTAFFPSSVVQQYPDVFVFFAGALVLMFCVGFIRWLWNLPKKFVKRS